MTVPIVFRKTPEVNKQVDWIDFATGSALVQFFPYNGNRSGAISFGLTTNAAMYSDTGYEEVTSTGMGLQLRNGARQTVTEGFTIEGDCIGWVALGCTETGGGSTNVRMNVSVHAIRGGVSTSYASVTTGNFTQGGNGTTSGVKAFNMTVPAVNLRPDDILEIEYRLISTNTGTGTVGWAFDPIGRDPNALGSSVFNSGAVGVSSIFLPIKGLV